jgi:hypothetical protein
MGAQDVRRKAVDVGRKTEEKFIVLLMPSYL